MRVTQASEQAQFLTTLDTLEANISETNNQLSTGMSFTTPAENPSAAGSVVNYDQALAQSLQYTANGQAAQTNLNTEDTALTQVTTQLQSLRSLALEANAGTVSTANLGAIATQAQQIQTSLLALANTQDGNGNYIFAGFAGQTQPFAATAAGASYSGDQGQQQMQIAAGQTIAAGDNGGTVFGGTDFNSIKTGNGTFAVAASANNTGSGLLGAATPTVPATYTAAAGAFTITFTSDTAYAITDTATGAAVTGPGNTGTYNAPSGTITYGGVQVAMTGQPNAYGNVAVTKGTGNTGTEVLGAATVSPTPTAAGGSTTYAGGTYTIKFITPATYSITDSTTGVATNGNYTSGQPITYGGVQVPMTGVPVANDTFTVAPKGDSFTVAPSTNQSIFTTVQNLITAISAGNGSAASSTQLSNSIAASLSNIDQALSNVSNVQASVGGRLSSITTQFSVATSQQLQLQSTITSLQGVNIAAAASLLVAQNTTLSAAMQAYTLTQGLSLFKYIS